MIVVTSAVEAAVSVAASVEEAVVSAVWFVAAGSAVSAGAAAGCVLLPHAIRDIAILSDNMIPTVFFFIMIPPLISFHKFYP